MPILLIIPSLGLLIMCAVMIYVQSITTDDETWQSQAIERGYATHCPSTGSFAWKEECS